MLYTDFSTEKDSFSANACPSKRNSRTAGAGSSVEASISLAESHVQFAMEEEEKKEELVPTEEEGIET